jgi:hypothetical protein
MRAKDYFKEEWSEVFKVDSTSPSGLSWKISGNNRPVGKQVGWLDSNGYWRCEYKSKAILVHRIIYHLENGDLTTEFVVDHIDRNPLNNSPENLRMITKAQNCRNKEMRKDNRTGINGVQECHFFIASWVQDGKSCSKTFSVFELGYENARNLAEELRSVKLKELNELGYNYAESHGKRV